MQLATAHQNLRTIFCDHSHNFHRTGLTRKVTAKPCLTAPLPLSGLGFGPLGLSACRVFGFLGGGGGPGFIPACRAVAIAGVRRASGDSERLFTLIYIGFRVIGFRV